MNLTLLIDVAFRHWDENKERLLPEGAKGFVEELENKINHLPISEKERMKLSDLNGSCVASYERYGFIEGFRMAAGIMQTMLSTHNKLSN